jgi:phosphatidylinositol-3-phosphatase
MGNLPARESATCGHPPIGAPDNTQRAVMGDQYASRHNPFVYFHTIIDTPACNTNVVALPALAADLKSAETTPNYVFITPNLCHDGHDGGEGRKCVDGQPGGLVSADAFLAETVPQILASPAFRQDGLLIVTFDEADIDLKYDLATKTVKLEGGDSSACCGEQPGPNIKPGDKVFGGLPDQGPGVNGPGGGRIGAVLVSPFIAPGTVSDVPYNHYSLLRSIEDMFGLDHLGYAGQAGLKPFGADIFRGAQ